MILAEASLDYIVPPYLRSKLKQRKPCSGLFFLEDFFFKFKDACMCVLLACMSARCACKGQNPGPSGRAGSALSFPALLQFSLPFPFSDGSDRHRLAVGFSPRTHSFRTLHDVSDEIKLRDWKLVFLYCSHTHTQWLNT